MGLTLWNPWHGCIKYSEGCQNCYVYRIDKLAGRQSDTVHRNTDFDMPVKRTRDGSYKVRSEDTVYTCLSSDFFLEDADIWRREAWSIIASRPDVNFVIITKRILRFYEQLPEDWGSGYENVTVACTCENQIRADERLPFFLELPIKHKTVICEPLLECIDLLPYLESGKIESVIAGGESGDFDKARPCDFDWILGIRDACIMTGTSFTFKQTGSKFIKSGKMYQIERKNQHTQAKKAKINVL
jgi:protein gp37